MNSETREIPQDVSEEEGVVVETRDNMDMLILMAEFTKSAIGIELMNMYEMESDDIYLIFGDPSILEDAVITLGFRTEPYMMDGAIPFFRLLAIESPLFYRQCLQDPDFDDELRERLRGIN